MKKIFSKIKNIIKSKPFNYVLAFILPILILFIVMCFKGVFFNGEKLAFGDMQAQYMHMLVYFKNIILGKESIFYSITKGLGGDMFSTVTYYMISPLNFIVLLFKTQNIMNAIYLIILIKFGLSSLTMYTYLSKKNPDKKNMAIIFSLCYSLMAYTVNNYFCIMWFDAIYMLPLILLGIDNIVDKKNPKLYIFTLFYTVFTNYYMGYMVCIFSVIYFVYLLLMKYTIKDKKEIFHDVIRFILSSLLAGLMACVIFFPSILDIMKANRSDLSSNATTIESALKRFFIGSYTYDNLLSYHEPNLYCGIITIILVLTYFFNEKHSDKEKYIMGSIFTLFILSVFIPALDLIWHGFSYPIGYNYRFTYLFSAFLIILAFREFNKDGITRVQRNSILGLALLAGMFAFSYNDNTYSWICVGMIILYAIIMFSKIKARNVLLVLLILFELCFNTYVSFFNADNETTYKNFVNKITSNFGEDNTYRVAGDIYYGTNELTVTGKSTTKGFYSTMNENITKFYNNVGMTGGINYYQGNLQAPPILSSLFGVKYIYTEDENLNYELLKEVETKKKKNNKIEKDKDYIYINNNYLSLGYVIRDNSEIGNNKNPFAYQNELITRYSGIKKNVLVKVVNGTNNNLVDSPYIYMIVYDNVSYITINEHKYSDFPRNTIVGIENPGINNVEIKAYTEGNEETNDYIAYYLDLSAYYSAINNLKLYELKDIVINKNKISGSIEMGYDATMVLTIPYEEGWTLYIDGEKTDYYKLNDIFMAVDLKMGNHIIELKYKPKAFYLSLFISLASVLMTYIYLKPKK